MCRSNEIWVMKFYASIPKIIFADFSRDSFRFFVPEKPRRIVTQIHVHFLLWKVKTQFKKLASSPTYLRHLFWPPVFLDSIKVSVYKPRVLFGVIHEKGMR